MLFTQYAIGKVLTEDDIRNCKKIAYVMGTFDPFTNGHENIGNTITSQLAFDCVLYHPNGNSFSKMPTPLEARYEMMEAALRDNPKLFYPSPEDLQLDSKSYIKKIKSLSKSIEVYAVLGSDHSPKNKQYFLYKYILDPKGYIIVGRGEDIVLASGFKKAPHHVLPTDNSTSSTQVRKWFIENEDVYFTEDVPNERYPNHLIHPKISEYIKENGLYIGSNGSTAQSQLGKAKTQLFTFLDKIGLYAPVKEQLIKRHQQNTLTDIEINGEKYPLKKHLGSGRTADAYIFNYNNQEHVIKIANDRPNSPKSIIQDVKVGQGLNYKTSIKVPEIQAVDPEGKWKIASFIGGESLGDYIKSRNGYIEPHIKRQLESIVSDMVNLSKKTNIKLDLSVDNLRIWNNKIYLIDAGPVPASVKHPMSYQEYANAWGRYLKIKINNKCEYALRAILTGNR